MDGFAPIVQHGYETQVGGFNHRTIHAGFCSAPGNGCQIFIMQGQPACAAASGLGTTMEPTISLGGKIAAGFSTLGSESYSCAALITKGGHG